MASTCTYRIPHVSSTLVSRMRATTVGRWSPGIRTHKSTALGCLGLIFLYSESLRRNHVLDGSETASAYLRRKGGSKHRSRSAGNKLVSMSFRGRGGGRGSFGGGRGGRGGRGGGRFQRDEGPPAEVIEAGEFRHECEGEAVVRLTNEKVCISESLGACQPLDKHLTASLHH